MFTVNCRTTQLITKVDTAVSGIPTTHLQVNHYFGCFKITFVADKLKAVVMYGS